MKSVMLRIDAENSKIANVKEKITLIDKMFLLMADSRRKGILSVDEQMCLRNNINKMKDVFNEELKLSKLIINDLHKEKQNLAKEN